ncbi:MAG: ATP-binding protein, partial [Actinobacteria bacterium]|nr:ATP-binding protein [Actinomycetota bacterium]
RFTRLGIPSPDTQSFQEDARMTTPIVDHRTLSILVHAASKTGKTTLSASSPRPIVHFDAEGGSKFLPGSQALMQRLGRPIVMVPWDPRYAPPVWDGTWDIAVVTVNGWDVVQRGYQWLASGQHQFQTVVIDSISEIQRRAKSNISGTEQMKIQDWGALLTVMDNVIRGFRDFTIDPYNPIRVAVFIAETRQDGNGKYIPYMQGQISVSLPYWMDVVAYLYVDQLPSQDGQSLIPLRRLLVAQHPQFEAGERVQGLIGPVIDDPDISVMLERIYPSHLYQPPQGAPVA